MATNDYSHSRALDWLGKAVPGFSFAYTHDAEFKAIINNQLRLTEMQVELMVVGSQTRTRPHIHSMSTPTFWELPQRLRHNEPPEWTRD